MAIKNDLEFLVKAEVRRVRERSGKEADACWCPLCEIDTVALALNQLPTRYCHEKNFGCAATQGIGGEVRSAVARAVQKVKRRPKHRPGQPLQSLDDIRMENYAQKIGDALVEGILKPASSACSCDQCRADVLACALNRYPPKYGVSWGVRESYQSNYAVFIRHEVGQEIAQAVKKVRERPHH